MKSRRFLPVVLVTAFALISLSSVRPAMAYGKCIFCGSRDYGLNCPQSPYKNGAHEHNDTDARCIYCGSTEYGRKCRFAPKDDVDNFVSTMVAMTTGAIEQTWYSYHQHGSGRGKCVFCGSKKQNTQCPNSPDVNHRHFY